MNRRALWLCAIAAPLTVTVAFASIRALPGPPLIDNVTPSLPLGLYRRLDRPVSVGAVVAVRQPPTARAYLKTLGFPADALLLKRVAAGPASRVCAIGDAVAFNGQILARAARDRVSTALPRWNGCRRLASNEIFLTGDGPRSFDSRYFGPVAALAIVGVYEALPS